GVAPAGERRGDQQADALLAQRAAGPGAGVAARPPDEVEAALRDRAADPLRAQPEGRRIPADEAGGPGLLPIRHQREVERVPGEAAHDLLPLELEVHRPVDPDGPL